MRIAAAGLLGVALLLPADAAAQTMPSGPRTAPAECGGPPGAAYLLGPDDEVEIAGLELDERGVNRMRIDGAGDIQVPLVGRVHVADLTLQQAQHELNQRFSTYIREPQITISVRELRSQPVSVLGAVNTPGIHQVRGYTTLLEMLSLAGGLRADAGHRIRIARQVESGCLPVPGATADASGRTRVAEVSVKEILAGRSPHGHLQIRPHDVISVERAQMVYVIGDVKRSGGFVIGDSGSMTVLQVLSLAEGMNGTADRKQVKVLRPNPAGGRRAEIAVDVKAILEGRSEDVALQGDDILFIPGSRGKRASLRALETAIQAGTGLLTGLLIWR